VTLYSRFLLLQGKQKSTGRRRRQRQALCGPWQPTHTCLPTLTVSPSRAAFPSLSPRLRSSTTPLFTNGGGGGGSNALGSGAWLAPTLPHVLGIASARGLMVWPFPRRLLESKVEAEESNDTAVYERRRRQQCSGQRRVVGAHPATCARHCLGTWVDGVALPAPPF
jgi:hypothetical protein